MVTPERRRGAAGRTRLRYRILCPMSSFPAKGGVPKIVDLEVKDARVIFSSAWEGLEEEVGRERLRFPKEIILLGGAPGAGKGTHTAFISQARGLTCAPIVISELLTTPV